MLRVKFISDGLVITLNYHTTSVFAPNAAHTDTLGRSVKVKTLSADTVLKATTLTNATLPTTNVILAQMRDVRLDQTI